jgi:hypothetical protein
MRAILWKALSSGALILGTLGRSAPVAAQPSPAYLTETVSQTAPQTVDRYGGWSPHAAAPSAYQGPAIQGQYIQNRAAPSPPARYLAWAGKADAQPQAPVSAAPPAGGSWTAISNRWGAQPAPQAAQQPMAPQRPLPPQQAVQAMAPPSASAWRPLYPQAVAQPTSIYDPPPAQPAASPAAPRQIASTAYQGTAGGPHFYSLHREYGIQPDAIPLPPKFFGPTADLSAPPNDPIVRRVTDSSGQTRTVAVPAPDDTSAQ